MSYYCEAVELTTNMRTHPATVNHNHRATLLQVWASWNCYIFNHALRQVYHNHNRLSCGEQLTHYSPSNCLASAFLTSNITGSTEVGGTHD